MITRQSDAKRINLMFRAFSDPTRLRILRLLVEAETCVGDLVLVLRTPQPSVSRHLAYLRRAGLVAARKAGLWCYYSLAPVSSDFHRSLIDCLARCFDQVPDIKADLKRASDLRKKGKGCCPETGAKGAATTVKRSQSCGDSCS
jgi:ArsR family transcriptional regulator